MNQLSITEAKRIRWRFRGLAALSLIMVTIGTVFMHVVEGLRWIDGLYFSVVSLTTVGYGDFTPQSDAAKIFIMFYLLIGIGIIAGLVNTLLRSAIARRVIKLDEQDNKSSSKTGPTVQVNQ
jgi:voltage-gated potassium channel Kch